MKLRNTDMAHVYLRHVISFCSSLCSSNLLSSIGLGEEHLGHVLI